MVFADVSEISYLKRPEVSLRPGTGRDCVKLLRSLATTRSLAKPLPFVPQTSRSLHRLKMIQPLIVDSCCPGYTPCGSSQFLWLRDSR